MIGPLQFMTRPPRPPGRPTTARGGAIAEELAKQADAAGAAAAAAAEEGVGGGGARITSPPNIAVVIAALEAEADTLRHADAAADAADRALIGVAGHTDAAATLAQRLGRPDGLAAGQVLELSHRLKEHRLAVARLASAAAYRGVPLFDGRYRLRVGGGKLELPDLVRSLPTQHALATLRGEVNQFRHRFINDRLTVVQATLQRTAQTRTMLLETPTAVSAATLTAYPALAVGNLLDLRA